ncbi:MAG: nucleotidyl transferase AbiEii/AbiGii toxin family protein [Candidatus Diapherotrites archaeon]|nr:nucleotidyl transferase AbiEii/AbiGii toxin family protein [Candidatus Diapherotrites archaeon]
MQIPLQVRLKRQFQRDVAQLQDLLVETTYALAPKAVMHGGTAIWRCFHGNRFSEDVDFYLPPPPAFQEAFAAHLENVNAHVTRFRKTPNSIYAKITRDRTTVSFEAALRKFNNPVVSDYEKADGTRIAVLTPSPEVLLKEKLNAFQNRKLIRDIYDVYHLSGNINISGEERRLIFGQLETLPRPVDESNLKNIVLTGAIPAFEQMKQTLKKRFSP